MTTTLKKKKTVVSAPANHNFTLLSIGQLCEIFQLGTRWGMIGDVDIIYCVNRSSGTRVELSKENKIDQRIGLDADLTFTENMAVIGKSVAPNSWHLVWLDFKTGIRAERTVVRRVGVNVHVPNPLDPAFNEATNGKSGGHVEAKAIAIKGA